MRVGLLGPLVVVDGQGMEISVPARKERAVLAVLALRAGRPVGVGELVVALWGDRPPQSAVKTAQTYVSALRRRLGPDTFSSGPGGYRLGVSADQVDVTRFESWLRDADEAAGRGEAENVVRWAGEALGLWRGEPLPDLGDQAVGMAEAARLGELRRAGEERLWEARLALGEHNQLVGELEAAVATEPLRERRWVLLMLALYRSGRQADALRAYQRLRKVLGEQLGLEPAGETQAMEAAVLAQDLSLELPAPRIPAAAGTLQRPPSGTVTFLFTDIEGSTRLWEERGGEMAGALRRHDSLLRETIHSNQGLVFSTGGDGLAAAFARAPDALAAAVMAQRQLGQDQLLRVRMGLHSGAAEERNGDYFGPALNRCARLAAAAHGGQVLCSGATAELLRDSLAAGQMLLDLGAHQLGDLSRPEHIFQIVDPSLLAEFPPLRTLAMFPTNLPAQAGPLVGRDDELTALTAALDAARLVTLTGVGGVGKTRLAIQAAANLLHCYRDGAWLVQLAPVVDPQALVEVIAGALEVPQRQGQTRAASLSDFLRAKHLLLVLDNCEHLLAGVAGFVEHVVSTWPQVVVLATSREGLGVSGERLLAVPPLRLPPDSSDMEGVRDAHAVRLFVARADEAKAGFALTAANADAIAQLVRRLDGLPLAIELAAARVPSMTPAELVQRLDERFRLLGTARRAAVERHQTLRQTIDWSYDLLNEPERRALQRAAVFSEDFFLASAEDVIAGEDIEPFEVAGLLGRLVAKSLLLADQRGEVTPYRMLETIRQYAQDQLQESGETAAVRRRHGQHYAGFAAWAGIALLGPDEASWTTSVDAELDQLRAAWSWAITDGDVDLAIGLIAPLAIEGTRAGYATRGWAPAVVTMPKAASHPLSPEILAWSGQAAMIAGDLDLGLATCQEALQLAEAPGVDDQVLLHALVHTAIVLMYAWRPDELARVGRRMVEIARAIGDEAVLVAALALRPEVYTGGDVTVALAATDEALVLARRLGNPTVLCFAATGSAMARWETDPERALEDIGVGLQAAESVGNQLGIVLLMAVSTNIHVLLGQWRQAIPLTLRQMAESQRAGDRMTFGGSMIRAALILEAMNQNETAATLHGTDGVAARQWGPFAELFAESEAALRSRLGEDRFAACVGRGKNMTDDELFALVDDELQALMD
jgi:predicted ATPase/DNA-binding SARP family transcriptional activator